MNKIVDWYGPDALNTHDWIGEQSVNFPNTSASLILLDEIIQYQVHTSQPMSIDMFIKPEESTKSEWGYGKSVGHNESYIRGHKAWKEWEPLFEGEWEIYKTKRTWRHALIEVVGNGEIEIEWEKITEKYHKDLNQFLTENKGLKYNTKFILR